MKRRLRLPCLESNAAMLDQLLSYLPAILQTVAWALVLWGWWSLKKIFVRHEDCQKCRLKITTLQDNLEKRLAELENRSEGMDKAISELPKAEDIHRLSNSITELQGSLNTLGKHIDGAISTLDAKVTGLNANMGLLMETHMKE